MLIWHSRFRWYVFPAPEVSIDDYTVKFMEPFSKKARVLSTRRYAKDKLSPFCPIDLGLSWGPMLEDSNLEGFRFWQTNRFLHYKYSRESEVEYWDIRKHIGNIHAIPANETIERQLFTLRPGAIIYFAGHLVRVDNDAGRGIWVSSRSRTDTGGGACEIIYITEIYQY